jgi:hypothetical protein
MRFAYADPPYLGCGKLYPEHPDHLDCDKPEWHQSLVDRLCDEFPDGWAMSLHSPSLRIILPMCPEDVRVCAWTKPFCVFKPNVNPAYAWEPVILRGGRKRQRYDDKVRDYCSVNIALQAGVVGAKPRGFCDWIFELLGIDPHEDEFVDLFPGSGNVGRSWEAWKRYELGLFAGMN